MRLVMIAECHVRKKQIVNKGRTTANDGRGETKQARVSAEEDEGGGERDRSVCGDGRRPPAALYLNRQIHLGLSTL